MHIRGPTVATCAMLLFPRVRALAVRYSMATLGAWGDQLTEVLRTG